MAQRMGVVLVGEGAIARQHLAALRRMDERRGGGCRRG